jgi:hypothetical protein
VFFTAKSVLIAARPHERRITRQVARAMDVAAVPGIRPTDGHGPVATPLGYFGRPRRRTGEVWAVGLVRDEADVIGPTIAHLVAEGVDHVLVADNGSVDGTRDLLADLAGELHVTVVDDLLPAHHQGVKVTRLARCAARAGAAWVVPFDADELWYSPHGRPLATALRSADPAVQVAVAPMWNHVMTDDDDPTEANPYLRLRTRLAVPLPVVKVAFRAHPWARVVPGNHNVRCPEGARSPLLAIRHVPYRSPEQIERKHRNGLAALQHDGIPDHIGLHWRELGALSPEQMLRRIAERAAGIATVVDPAPFRPPAGGSAAGVSAARASSYTSRFRVSSGCTA